MGLKYPTRLRLGFSHLNDHKNHDTLEVESIVYYFLHCLYYNEIYKTLVDTVKKSTNISVFNLSD